MEKQKNCPFDIFKNIDSIAGMGSNYEQRKVNTYKKGKIFIDTAWVDDMNWYETAVEHPKYKKGSMIIVEQYGKDKKKAQEGHKKWVKKMTSTRLPVKLTDIDMYGREKAFGEKQEYKRCDNKNLLK